MVIRVVDFSGKCPTVENGAVHPDHHTSISNKKYLEVAGLVALLQEVNKTGQSKISLVTRGVGVTVGLLLAFLKRFLACANYLTTDQTITMRTV